MHPRKLVKGWRVFVPFWTEGAWRMEAKHESFLPEVRNGQRAVWLRRLHGIRVMSLWHLV